MRPHLYVRLALLPVLLLGALLYGQAAKAVTQPAATFTRTLEPVIVSAPALPAYYNAPVSQLFVFKYSGSTWTQIPFQVDERTNVGQLVATNDQLFNCGTNSPPPCGTGNTGDEIVFMAKDLGDAAPTNVGPMVNGSLVSITWYKVTVNDPTNSGAQGFVYITQSSSLTQPTTGYVSYDTNNHRINGQSYHLGYTSGNAYFDYLTLSDSTDVLDRTPKILGCAFTIIQNLCLNEESNLLKGQGLQLIKNGPVRVTLRSSANDLNNEVQGYGWTASSSSVVQAPVKPTSIRQSTDWSADNVGSTLFNSAVPGGVTIDGQQDTVPATPYSPWWEMSGSHGSVVFAGNPAPAGGTLNNYYYDSSSKDPSDPSGDTSSYGNIGSLVNSPNNSFTYPFNFYFLGAAQPSSAGTTYYNYFQNPLTVSAQVQQLPLPARVWLPYVTK